MEVFEDPRVFKCTWCVNLPPPEMVLRMYYYRICILLFPLRKVLRKYNTKLIVEHISWMMMITNVCKNSVVINFILHDFDFDFESFQKRFYPSLVEVIHA